MIEQPPVALFSRFDQSDWTAKEWLPTVMLVAADGGPRLDASPAI